MSDSVKIIFANVNGDITAIENITSTHITTYTSNITIENYIFGRYEYTTPSDNEEHSETGGFVLDTTHNTISVYTETREVTPNEIFSAIETAAPHITITSPTYDADTTYELYESFGVETELYFRTSVREFTDELQHTNPEHIIQEQSLNDTDRNNVQNIADVIQEQKETNAYIESMTLQLPEIAGDVKFTAPSILDISPQTIDYKTRITLHNRFNKMHTNSNDSSLHPSEQWSERIYTELTTHDEIPDRGVSIIGNGYDDTVIVAVDPFCQIQVRSVLRDMGFTPEMTGSYTGFEITPDMNTEENKTETNSSNGATRDSK